MVRLNNTELGEHKLMNLAAYRPEHGVVYTAQKDRHWLRSHLRRFRALTLSECSSLASKTKINQVWSIQRKTTRRQTYRSS